VTKAVMANYPEYPWRMWKFQHAKMRNWWMKVAFKLSQKDQATLEMMKEFVRELEKTHQIKDHQDWYRISGEQLGSTTQTYLSYLGGIVPLLQKVYPDVQWEVSRFKLYSKKAAQRTFVSTLQAAIPNEGTLDL